MKTNLIYLILIYTFTNSCRKSNSSLGNASLNVIQATLDIPAVYVYFTNSPSNYYLNQSFIGNSSAGEFSIPTGSSSISIISTADTSNHFFEGTLFAKPGGIYSLYLIGQTVFYDTLFLQDQIPYYADSSVGIRFINLTLNSGPMSVNIAGTPATQTEFSNLTYKHISAFKKYSALGYVGGSYNFEIRDQSSDSLLATFIWNYNLRKNNTIIISGSEFSSGTTGINAFQVNNY